MSAHFCVVQRCRDYYGPGGEAVFFFMSDRRGPVKATANPESAAVFNQREALAKARQLGSHWKAEPASPHVQHDLRCLWV